MKDFDAQAGHARELAYRLHAIAERNNWPKEALAYNSLVSSWPEIMAATVQLNTEKTEKLEQLNF